MPKKSAAAPQSSPRTAAAPVITSSGGAAPAPARIQPDRADPAAATPASLIRGPVRRVVVSMSVNFVVTTTDGLRQVAFGLEKNTKGTDIEWQIHFTLLERSRKTDSFDTIVSLDVQVDTSLAPQAEAMAHNKPTPDQAAHILGPLADDSKLVQTGDLPKAAFDEEAQQALG
jgi:hypothetical protein